MSPQRRSLRWSVGFALTSVLAGGLSGCGTSSIKTVTKTVAAATSHASRTPTKPIYSGHPWANAWRTGTPLAGSCGRCWGSRRTPERAPRWSWASPTTSAESQLISQVRSRCHPRSLSLRTGWTVLGGNGGNTETETELEVSSDLVTLASKSTNATVVGNGHLQADPGRSILALGITSTGSKTSANGSSGGGAASATPVTTTATNGGPSGPAPRSAGVSDAAFVSPSGKHRMHRQCRINCHRLQSEIYVRGVRDGFPSTVRRT